MLQVSALAKEARTAWPKKIPRDFITVGSAALASKATGYIRELAMAFYFGTSMSTDAWLVASALPNLLVRTVSGAIDELVVPLIIEAKNQTDYDEHRFINELFTVITGAALVLTVVAELACPWIVRVVAPGFHGWELVLATLMSRILVPTFAFWLWSGLFSGILQAHGLYFVPAWAPLSTNILRIASIALLGSRMGIVGVAWGFLISTAFQAGTLTATLVAHGFHPAVRLTLKASPTDQFFRLATPILLITSAGNVGYLIDRILASWLPVGTIAALNYGALVSALPSVMLVLPLLTPIYTAFQSMPTAGAWASGPIS